MRAPALALAACLLALIVSGSRTAAADVDLFPTGLSGGSPSLASANDGSLHMLYYAGSGLRHARLVSGTFVDDALVPDSGTVSQAKYNRPSLDVGPDSVPHVVWGPMASWTDATTHSKGVWYWDGSATTQIFGDYTEYVALGVSNAGQKVFATAVVFLPGDTAGHGIGWAQLNGDVLDPITHFSVSDIEGKHVAFCKGQDNALHLVWRMQKVRYTRWDGAAWSAVDGLGANLPSSAELPSCAVDAQGQPHVAWLRWQDMGAGAWAPADLRYAHQTGAGWAPSSEGAVVMSLPSGGTSPGVAVLGAQVLIAWTEGSTLFSRLSADGGESFGPAQAQATDLEPGGDLADNAPQLPLVAHEGRFQTVYTRSDGTLVRLVWTSSVAPGDDAGAGAEADAADEAGQDASTETDASGEAAADAPGGAQGDAGADAAGSDASSDADAAAQAAAGSEPGDVGGTCACRAAAPGRGAQGVALCSLLALVSLAARRRARCASKARRP